MNAEFQSGKNANRHTNSTAPAPPAGAPMPLSDSPPASHQPGDSPPPAKTPIVALIPPPVRHRKYRACSFMSKLTEEQHIMLSAWLLNKAYSIEDVRQKVAAPPPTGFGLEVHRNTLRRVRTRYDNASSNMLISDSIDLACDILEAEDAAETAPLLQSLIVMLYSRALYAAKKEAEPSAIDQLVTTIARLERLKSRSQRAHRERSPVTTRHQIELSVVSSSTSDLQSDSKVANLKVTALPDTKKELEPSDPHRQNTP